VITDNEDDYNKDALERGKNGKSEKWVNPSGLNSGAVGPVGPGVSISTAGPQIKVNKANEND
jgi:hypothetical protein